MGYEGGARDWFSRVGDPAPNGSQPQNLIARKGCDEASYGPARLSVIMSLYARACSRRQRLAMPRAKTIYAVHDRA